MYYDIIMDQGKNSMVVRIQLEPDLEHCVESLAKRRYTEFVETIVDSKESDIELTEKVELLRIFLETADFKSLRAESEKHLLNNKTVRFILYLENGHIVHNMLIV
jgi:hypothetical protein